MRARLNRNRRKYIQCPQYEPKHFFIYQGQILCQTNKCTFSDLFLPRGRTYLHLLHAICRTLHFSVQYGHLGCQVSKGRIARGQFSYPRIATKLDRFYTRRKNQFENLELLLCQQIELLTKYNNVFVYLLSKLDNPHYHTTNFSLFLTVSKPSLKIGSVNKAFLF